LTKQQTDNEKRVLLSQAVKKKLSRIQIKRFAFEKTLA